MFQTLNFRSLRWPWRAATQAEQDAEAGRIRMKSPTPTPPVAGQVLFTRRVRSTAFRIIYSDGQSEIYYRGPDDQMRAVFLRRGLPVDQCFRALDYIWNFGRCYVNAPNVKLPTLAEKAG